jgi:uncharacterized repeat protein (TIGR03803 family)
MTTGKRLVQGLVIGLSLCICLTSALADPYAILHNFGATGDGYEPIYGGLTLSGATLYGCCEYGGTPYIHTNGTVFKINTNGSGYQVIHNFWEDTNNQCNPIGAPVVSGSRLYGTTISSLTNLNGEIFAMNTDGGAFQVLHEFAGKPGDGATPNGSLTLVGSRLYGMTVTGGKNGIESGGAGNGVIFAINTDRSNYQVLHDFGGYPADGAHPYGSLTLVGSKLYGMTAEGGPGGGGVVFSMNLDGGGYQVILDINSHDFATGGPFGSLTLWGGKLYGLTSGGGPGGASGVIFRVNPDGTGYQILHSFKYSQGDGGQPMGDVTFAGSRLFGWTYANGTYNGGVFFSYQPPQANTGMMLPLLLLD